MKPIDTLILRAYLDFKATANEQLRFKQAISDSVEYLKTLPDPLKIHQARISAKELLREDFSKIPEDKILRAVNKYISLEQLLKLEAKKFKECVNAINESENQDNFLEVFENFYGKYLIFRENIYPLLYEGLLNHKN